MCGALNNIIFDLSGVFKKICNLVINDVKVI